MAKILDSAFLEEIVKQKQDKVRNNRMKTWLQSWSDLAFLTKFILTGVLSSAVLVALLASPSFLGIRTILGAYEDSVNSMVVLEQQMDSGNSQIAVLQQKQQALSARTLPVALQNLHMERAKSSVDFEEVLSRLYRLLDEVVPQNIVHKTVVISALSWDADNNLVHLKGTVNNGQMSMLDGKLIGSGYSLLSYYVLNANRSPYFMDGSVGEVEQPDGESGQLSFTIDLRLQATGTVDKEDNEETFLDYLQNQVDTNKVKR